MNTNQTNKLPIEIACDILGGQSSLAKLLKVSNAFVNQLVKGKRFTPACHCPLIEDKTGVSRKLLRPNDWEKYWPELTTSD